MCAHYDPQTAPARLSSYFGVDATGLDLAPSLWPGYLGPFIRRHQPSEVVSGDIPSRELLVGSFGLIPHWAKDVTIARRTYNARSETVHEKPSYRDAWRLARHCIIPAEAIYEPDWRTGRAIPTRIARADGKPMGIAGFGQPGRTLRAQRFIATQCSPSMPTTTRSCANFTSQMTRSEWSSY